MTETPRKTYSDFIRVQEKYSPTMTREEINTSVDKWLDFYPHRTYCDFLDALFEHLKKGANSIWLYGNYGTGKSHASLVTQKLFMDAEERVDKFLSDCEGAFPSIQDARKSLMELRGKTLVVYDYDAQGVGPDQDFLVRLERGVCATLKEYGYKTPGRSNLDAIKERLRREGAHFFKTMEELADELQYLPTYDSIEEIESKLDDSQIGSCVLAEVAEVFRKDGIFLDVTPQSFLKWIRSVREANGLERVVYIFDEFSSFIDAHKTQLKTMETITENPGHPDNRFFFIPVTHLSRGAFFGEKSQSAQRAKDRFCFKRIEMPEDVAFSLAARALKPYEEANQEWKDARDKLGSYLGDLPDRFQLEKISRARIIDILPIHPTAAYLLKVLAEMTTSNQRSLFGYLAGKEFLDFIKNGGPNVSHKQFLTVDYLWSYFVERDDLGVDDNVKSIRLEFERIRNQEFKNAPVSDPLLRVLKAAMLYVLISKFIPSGNRFAEPSIENVKLSFKGDGAVIDVEGKIEELCQRRCLTKINDRLNVFAESANNDDLNKKTQEILPKFQDYMRDCVESKVREKTKNARAGFLASRFEFRATDPKHTNQSAMNPTTRAKFSAGLNNDDGSICLWSVMAKNNDDEVLVSEQIEKLLKQLYDHRILMFSFGSRTLCENKADEWNQYANSVAQAALAVNNSPQKKSCENECKRIAEEWTKRIGEGKVTVYQYRPVEGSKDEGEVVNQTVDWDQLKSIIVSYASRTLPYSVEPLAGEQSTALGNVGLKSWALAGLNGSAKSGPISQMIGRFQGEGVTWEDGDSWFKSNPDHILSHIREFFEKKVKNTIGAGSLFSLRRVYLELKRAPYGMRATCITAFCLGFCLRFLLNKNYQWTDGKMTDELTADALAEIIESVVKNDGEGEIKNEKKICRLTSSEKNFVKYVPKAFGITVPPNSRVEDAIAYLQALGKVAEKIPLWTLHYAIDLADGVADSQKEEIATMLRKLCKVCGTSAKNKTSEYSDNVKSIGDYLANNPAVVDIISQHAKTEYFLLAFRRYVDEKKPEFQEQATKVGDKIGQYCRFILDKARDTSTTLWNEDDLASEINKTYAEYETIERVQRLLNTTDFLEFKQAIEELKKRVQSVGLPKDVVVSSFPSLESFVNSLFSETSNQHYPAGNIRDALDTYDTTIRELFFDAQKGKALGLVRSRLSSSALTDDDLRALLNAMPEAFQTPENTYWEQLTQKVEERQKTAVAGQLRQAWLDFSGTKSPDDWAQTNHMPTRFLFDDQEADVANLFQAIEKPNNFSEEKLREFIDRLKGVSADSIVACQKRFLDRIVPEQYKRFDIKIGALTLFLSKKYGEQPNKWGYHLDISEFIRDQYQFSFAPQIMEKVSKLDAEELKKMVIDLVKKNQEVGMFFWSDE